MMHKWYHNMVDPETKMLTYEFEPDIGMRRHENCPIRNIGAVWSLETLSNHLGDHSLQDTIDRSVEHFVKSLIQFEKEGSKMMTLDPRKMQEHPSIAHNAMMILCLSELRDRSEYLEIIECLADAILSQQRFDGSFEIYFGGSLPDFGKEFYPGEAVLSLARAYDVTSHPRFYRSVASALSFYREAVKRVTEDMIVFFANWQSQGMCALYNLTEDSKLKLDIRDFVLELQDRVEASRFYESIKKHPRKSAVVKVACGCEALADAYSLLTESDSVLKARYARNLQTVVQFLLDAQMKEQQGLDSHGVGGFGHTMDIHTQRIDVTGHVMNSFIKLEKLIDANRLTLDLQQHTEPKSK
jgi:hypothetical protein